MSRDVDDLLQRTADAPTRPLDTAAVVGRARRQTRLARAGAGLGAVAVIAVASLVALPMVAGDDPGLEITDTPDDGQAQVAVTAGDPEHALLVLADGTLVADELATGERTELAEPLHTGTDVLDLAVSVGSSLEDFTAIAYDDGTGPLGFVTYARRDGGPIEVTFTDRDRWQGNISNRGFRTIAPDGRWLAYSGVRGPNDDTLTTYLVPLDADTAEPQLEQTVVLDTAIGPLEWTGPVTDPGDVSRITGWRDGALVQLLLEHTDGGFTVTDVTPPLITPDDGDPDWPPYVAFAAQVPGSEQDPRFVLTQQRAEIEVGEQAGLDRAIVTYTGPNGRAEIELPLGYNVGNLDFAARGGTALVVADRVEEDPATPERISGRAFVINLDVTDTGQLTFDEPVQLADGPTTGALLGGLR